MTPEINHSLEIEPGESVEIVGSGFTVVVTNGELPDGGFTFVVTPAPPETE